MPRLWIARHAQPLIAAGTCYGQLDVPADEASTQQAAAQLAQALPHNLIATYSPLQRCAQLASALQKLRPDLAVTPDPNLKEMHFGAWEGVAWNQINPAELAEWTDQFASYAPKGGESVSAFMRRVALALSEARKSMQINAQDCLWISHAGVARAASLIANGQTECTRADQWPSEGPAFGALWVLELSQHSDLKQPPQ